MGKPAIFRQWRPGHNETLFQILKFRTMREAFLSDGRPMPDAERLTRLGKWLRCTSLDELPELWNVLKGDMSLVGPRPLLPEYMARYTPIQRRRHEVKPGITGWAQVNGRNRLTWEKKFELDVWYVDHRSIWLDAKILLMTMVKVVCTEGISRRGHATMPEFKGSLKQSRPDG
jgi:sugar transferase EpsL